MSGRHWSTSGLRVFITASMLCALAACTQNAPSAATGNGSAAGVVTVISTDDSCQLSAAQAPAGALSFAVTNKGSQVTEFYLLASDKKRIVAEVENVGPGLTRNLVLNASPGSYYSTCKPGMKGDGIQSEFTITAAGATSSNTVSAADAELLATANSQYANYVRDQSAALVTQTKAFTAAYLAGKDDQARSIYPNARLPWERIEPVAESFGDLDPSMDAREADLEPGQKWTGWHVMEKDLWPPAQGYTPLTAAQRREIADKLNADTATLQSRTLTMTFTTDQIANGAKSLLDEVATGKVTGEEEVWSHTDLWDFQGNVDGARFAWQGLRPILQQRDAALDTQIATRFSALQALLDSHRKGDGFVFYNQLTPAQVKALSDAVNALSEPMSKLTAAVI